MNEIDFLEYKKNKQKRNSKNTKKNFLNFRKIYKCIYKNKNNNISYKIYRDVLFNYFFSKRENIINGILTKIPYFGTFFYHFFPKKIFFNRTEKKYDKRSINFDILLKNKYIKDNNLQEELGNYYQSKYKEGVRFYLKKPSTVKLFYFDPTKNLFRSLLNNEKGYDYKIFNYKNNYISNCSNYSEKLKNNIIKTYLKFLYKTIIEEANKGNRIFFTLPYLGKISIKKDYKILKNEKNKNI